MDLSSNLFVLIVIRVTLLLAIAWLLQMALRGKNPCWQIALWRTTVVGLVFIMLGSAWYRGWGPRLWTNSTTFASLEPAALTQVTALSVKPIVRSTTEQTATTESKNSTSQSSNRSTAAGHDHAAAERDATNVGVHIEEASKGVAKLYFVIVAMLLIRLLLRDLWLRAMLRRAEPADSRLTELVSTSVASIGLGVVPRVVVSPRTTVPLATGLFRRAIVLPADFSDGLDEQSKLFVLSHECCHFKGHDLFWSLASRIVQIVLWPHPLAWGLSSAHRYACDLRADRVAAGQQADSYASMLAAMALKLDRRPLPPFAMAFLRRPEVLSRIRWIESGTPADRPASGGRLLAALGAIVVLAAVGTIGVNAEFPADQNEVGDVLVKVVDQGGNPIVGAEIHVHGLRARKESASAHGNRFFDLNPWRTDESGSVEVIYPRYVYEEMETGHLIMHVSHSDYVRHDGQGHAVDGPILIKMMPGRKIQITAIDKSSGDRISNRLFALLPGGDPMGKSFHLEDDGNLVSKAANAKTECLLVVALPEAGPPLFSDLIDLRKLPAGDLKIDNVAMSPGVCLSGKLSDNVTLPVENGQIGLAIAATVNPTPAYDNCIFWNDFVTINEDGTFVFPSVPRGLAVQLSAIADGWVSRSAAADQIQQRFPYVSNADHAQAMHDSMVVAQLFDSIDEEQVELQMEPTSICRVKVVTSDGTAVANANVSMSPNLAWSPGPGGIVGHYDRTIGSLLSDLNRSPQLTKENPESFSPSPLRYAKTTGDDGIAIVSDLPGKQTGVGVDHADFEMPAQGGNPFLRSGNVQLTPGAVTDVTITVQPKGREVLGR